MGDPACLGSLPSVALTAQPKKNTNSLIRPHKLAKIGTSAQILQNNLSLFKQIARIS